ncbi:MAG: SpoIIE family protein phosphatase [Planctomycetota bacterium]
MPSTDTPLTRRVSLPALQRVQERFAELGRMTVCLCTPDGGPLTTPTWGSAFSRLLGTSGRGREEWASAMRACAADPNPPTPHRCHEGITLYATPIVSDATALGLLVVGIRKHRPPQEEKVARIARAFGVAEDELREAAASLNPLRGGTPEAIHRFADVLADIIATLHAQADRIADQLADLQTVHGLSQLLSGTIDLQQMLDITVHRVVEVMQVKACAIRLLNEDTGELVIKAVCNLSDEYLRKGPVLLDKSPIDSTAFAGHTVYIADAPNDPRLRYPENARREGIVSGLCVPMTYRGQTIGVIRVYTGRRYVFSEGESALLQSIGSQAASAIVHTRLYEDQAKADRVARQLQIAGQIQRRMLPAAPPNRRGLSFGCVYVPSLQLSGDFYDFIHLPDGDLGVCIADVVGKGVPAALLMASIRSALRAFAPTSDNLTRIVRQVNRHLCQDSLASEFATFFYGVLSLDGSTLSYCNAGHHPPVLLRGDTIQELTTGGMAIGLSPCEPYECGSVALQSGDLIVMVTDGVTEAMNFEGAIFGRLRLLESIHRHRAIDAAQLAQQILWDVRRFAGLAEQSDDITIVVLKVSEPFHDVPCPPIV